MMMESNGSLPLQRSCSTGRRWPQTQQQLTQLKLRKIRFIDDNRNHAIDGGESSKIIFEIMNEGRNPVYDVVPIVETVGKVKHIGISPTVMIEEILPGEGIRYTATVYAGSKLKDGEVTFRVAVSDENGVICDSQEFTLPTQRADQDKNSSKYSICYSDSMCSGQ